MNKYILILVMGSCASLQVNAQEFVAPVKHQSTNIDSTTTYTYKMTNNTYKVYKTKIGAYYIWKNSKKTNKKYRMYLPKEIQIQMGRKYETNSK